MRNLSITLGLLAAASIAWAADKPSPTWKKTQLTDKFYCEGAYYGDFNKDGKMDIVSGPYWYEGPDFTKKHEIYTPKEYDPKGYSDNFLTYCADFNGDGWTDVFYVPFPGKEGYWYENPGNSGGAWKKHLAMKGIDNESPMWADINGDGRPELICNHGGNFGFATWDPAKPDAEWVWHPISEKGKFGQFTHGIGIGDIKGDGGMCMLEGGGWYERPANWNGTDPWIKHNFKFGDGPSQMYVYDVDGDGLNDVITVLHCHQYGLAWYKQIKDAQGAISFEKHLIMGSKPEENAQGWKHSQLHAVDLVNLTGSGLKGILTGKRFWAHGPSGDAEPSAPAVVIFFELKRDKDKGVQWIGHLIDDDSGVGTQVQAVEPKWRRDSRCHRGQQEGNVHPPEPGQMSDHFSRSTPFCAKALTGCACFV